MKVRPRTARLPALGLLLAAGGWLFATEPGHYVWCLMNEGRWMKAQSRSELESRLGFHDRRVIEPAQSAWGHAHVLQEGETMVRYHILKDPTCPLDVVVGPDGSLRAFYASYE